MENKYVYDDRRYFTRFILIGYFMVAAAVYCAFMFFSNMSAPFSLVYLFFLAAAVYGSANTFLLNANPKEIVFTDDSFSFSSLGKTHTYKVDELEYFHVKELPSNYQLYLRVGTKSGKKRRYWVSYDNIENGLDIVAECHYIERKLHPTSIKFNGWDRGLHRPQHKTPEQAQEAVKNDSASAQ